jgi:hypothetical protein
VLQAEALWETNSQIAGLACQDTRYKGPVYQTARLNNNNQSTHNFHNREVTLSCDILSREVALALPATMASPRLEQSVGTSFMPPRLDVLDGRSNRLDMLDDDGMVFEPGRLRDES